MFGVIHQETAKVMITYTGYTLLLMGEWMIFGKEIMRYWKKKRRPAGLKERLADKDQKGKAETHIKSTLMAAFSGRVSNGAFIRASGATMILAALISLGRYVLWQYLLITVVAGLIPYLICRILAESRRSASSNEAEGLVAALLNEYRVRGGNILEALEATMLQAKDLKASRRFLFVLLSDMQNAKNDEKRREAAARFAQAIGTGWGRLLAENISNAVCTGIEISLSLEDILLQMKDARLLAEERKRLNSESVRMVKMLIPAAYAGSLYLGVKFAGIGWDTVLQNQFGTKQGFFLFFMIVSMFLANTMLIEIVRNKRFDF